MAAKSSKKSLCKKLISAAENDDKKGLIDALKQGADINYQEPSENETALFKAVDKEHIGIVKTLLERDAQIHVRNRLGWTALHLAAFHGSVNLVDLFLQHGGDVDIKNYQEETPLMLAACYGKVCTVKLLLKHGARTDCTDWAGKSVLGYAQASFMAEENEKKACIDLINSAIKENKILTSKASVQSKKTKGNAAFREKKYNLAVALYTQAIKENESDHILYSNRSAALFELGEFAYAKDDAFKCIGIKPDFAKGYMRLAKCNIALEEYEIAIRNCRDGLALDPTDEIKQELLRLRERSKISRVSRDTVPSNIVFGDVKGFPPSQYMHATRDPIFASGSSDDEETVRVWVTIKRKIDACIMSHKGEIVLIILILNTGTDAVIVEDYENSFMLQLRNESIQKPSEPHCKEINGEAVNKGKLKNVYLRQSQWAVLEMAFCIPGPMIQYEGEALKKCHHLMVKYTSSGIDDDVVCLFHLSYIREFYDGFIPGRVCNQNPLHPKWLLVDGFSPDEEETDYDDEKYMSGFTVKVKEVDSKDSTWEYVVQVNKPVTRADIFQSIENNFYHRKVQELRPCVVELIKYDGSKVLSDNDLADIYDFMRFQVKFGRGCCTCRKPEEDKFRRCSRCKKARYCSRDCQVSDWDRHKPYCNKKATSLQNEP